MTEKQFIEKYNNKEFKLIFFEQGDINIQFIFYNDVQLNEQEEEYFWMLLPYTKEIYKDSITEILKLEYGTSSTS